MSIVQTLIFDISIDSVLNILFFRLFCNEICCFRFVSPADILAFRKVRTGGLGVERNMNAIKRLTIRGFKSIRELNAFELKNLNVLIGANGAGKSNLISFFSMLPSISNEVLDKYVLKSGGASDLLFNGPETTKEIVFRISFGDGKMLKDGSYKGRLTPIPRNTLVLADEVRTEQGISGWQHETRKPRLLGHNITDSEGRIL